MRRTSAGTAFRSSVQARSTLTSQWSVSMNVQSMAKYDSAQSVLLEQDSMHSLSPSVETVSEQSAFERQTGKSETTTPISLENTEPEFGTPDEENPEWTRERMAKAMRYPNFPPELMRLIEADNKKRGPQKAPRKQAISIRLSADVLEALRATGPGWQARVDDALRTRFVSK